LWLQPGVMAEAVDAPLCDPKPDVQEPTWPKAKVKTLEEPATKLKRRLVRRDHLPMRHGCSVERPFRCGCPVRIRLGDELGQEPSTSPAVRHSSGTEAGE
jgi:hypothetical protein